MNAADKCFECGAVAKYAHHVVPRVKGGTKTVPLCGRCHGLVHGVKTMRIGELAKKALTNKKASGFAVSRAPIGMKLVQSPCGGGSLLVPDPASSGYKLVARARELRAAGLSFARIAERLMLEGFRPERGQRIHDSTIHYMLTNPRLRECVS